ncbi:MAG: hypothetical protein HZB39_05070 [Planctomycetes bacterium]|nr:hypothetical protein [Planctomycetota bacterium]
MTIRLIAGIVAVALLAGAGVGISRSSFFQDPQDPDGPNASRTPVGPQRTTSLMLTVQLDANGVQVMQGIRKPDLDWVAPRNLADLPFRWTMHDAEGRPIAEGGFDPARMCLDPTHAGQPAHVEGDVAIPHVNHTNIKVPDLAAFDRIEFTWRDQVGSHPFGVAQKRALELR